MATAIALIIKFLAKAIMIFWSTSLFSQNPTTGTFLSQHIYCGFWTRPGTAGIDCPRFFQMNDSTEFHIYPLRMYFDSAMNFPSQGNPQNLLWLNPSTKLLQWSSIDSLLLPNTNPVGTITMYAGASSPPNYLMCDGAAVSRTTYAALFVIIGTTYGAGDGSTTFNLPDMRQRFPLGKAASGTGSTLAGTGGTIDHIHTVDPPNTTSGAPSGTSGQLVGVINVASATHTHDVNIAQFNSGAANPPYLVINYIIKY
jgi:microcystin-dependent protein